MSLSSTVVPLQPDAHVAVIVKVVAPASSGVGFRKAFQRPSTTVAGTV